MNTQWFTEWFREAFQASHLTRGALARAINCHSSDISRWLAGGSPNQEYLGALLQFFGGDVERALPTYNPLRDFALRGQHAELSKLADGLEPITTKGVIEGMTVKPTRTESASVEDMRRAKKSKLWALTKGPVIAYDVIDASMVERYPEGCTIFFREPKAVKLPDKCDCLVRMQDGRLIFRQLRWLLIDRKKKLCLRALSPVVDDIFVDPGEVEILGVALEARFVNEPQD